MKNPKQTIRNLLLFGLVSLGILSTQPLFATHIIGGELSYRYLGGSSYEITLDLYRNCLKIDINGDSVAAADPVSYIGIFRENGQPWPTISKNDMKLDLIDRDTIPNNIAGDPCLFVPGDVCVERIRYQKIFNIVGSGGFYVVYQRCCRNADILNITNPEYAGATYWLHVTQLARTFQNSSPNFGFYPPVFVCVNKEIEHPHAATDINGDSLVYKFYTPFVGGSHSHPQPVPIAPPLGLDSLIQPPPFQNITWVPPYGLSQMLGPSAEPLTINSASGLITGMPQIQGRFVVGVLVEEYRSGQLLSVVRRDFQYEVGTCAELDVQIVAPDAQCDDLTVQFGNETDIAQNFVWYFDWPNQTPNSLEDEPTYTFPDTGTYTIALIAEPVGACVDTGYHTIYLQNNSLTPDFDWQTYDCDTSSVLALTDLSTDPISAVVEWNWTVDLGGGQVLTSTQPNPVFTIPNPSGGTISLTVRSVNGCEQTKTVQFESGNNNPVDDLPSVIQICLGEMAHLNPAGGVPGFTYQWGAPVMPNQQNLPNPTVAPLQTTTYAVTITGLNGLCQSTATVTVEVLQPVDLSFAPDTDCDARTVHFVNTSTNAPTGYVWEFGDPSTTTDVSTEANPTWDYPAFGQYTVTLMTPPNAVCKDTIFKEIELTEKILQASFSYEYTDCDEEAVTIKFYDETNNSENNTVGWLWTFDGVYSGTSTVMNPTITVTQEGVLEVTLQVSTSENCKDTTATATVPIDLTGLPWFGADSISVLGCINGGVILNPGGDTTYIYEWSPADGLSCTDCPSPHANPSQTTTYYVHILNPNGGDTCDINRIVTVIVTPDVGLDATGDTLTCAPSVTLHSTVQMLPVDFSWCDQNGMPIAGDVDSVTVIVSGYDWYVAKAIDEEGCPWYDTVFVAGGPPDIDAVGEQIICSNDTLQVFATNLDPADTLTWQWTPTDIFNGPTDVPNPNVIELLGERWAYVKATNQFGCMAFDSTYIAVVDTANVLDFDYFPECNGSTVNFVNLSTNAFNFSWNFGDPTTDADTSHLDNPVYTYPSIGTYTVQLTMDFNLSCVDTLTKEITIDSTQFIPDFTFEYLECETDSVEVQFSDATTITQNGISVDSLLWVTSEGDTSSLPNPIFTIYAGQTFIVTMTAYTSNGCNGSITKELKLEFIEESIEETIVLCPGDSVFINPFGNVGYEYHWTPNIDISDPNVPNPQVWPSQTTTYSVEITNFSPDTCSITRTVTIFVPEKVDVAAPADTLTCGGVVQLCAVGNIQSLDYQWFVLPNDLVGTGACIGLLPSADQEYEVVATDQYGCFDRDTVFVANEQVQANWQPVGIECPDTEVQLTVSNFVVDHNLTYVWTTAVPGQILPPATGPTVTAVVPPAGQAATYTVTATNQFGCTQSLSQNIGGYNFVPTVVPNVEVCPGVAEPLNPGANTAYNYQWSPSTGLDSPSLPNPTVTVSQSTTYVVTVTGDFGAEQCVDTLVVEVFSAPVIDITETVDTFTCGEPIVISAVVNVPVVSSFWKDSAGNVVGNDPDLTVDPAVGDTYTLCVTDQYGCTEQDDVEVDNNQLDILLDGNGVIDTCPMPTYNLCITNLDPNDLLMFEWSASNGGQIVANGDEACAEVSSQQGVTSIFNVLVENQWGCSEMEQFSVQTYEFEPIVRETVTACPDEPTPLNPDAVGSTLSYFWTPSTGLSCNDCPNPIATLSTSQFYQVEVQGYNLNDTCSFMQTVQVIVAPYHNLQALPGDTVLCDSSDILLTASYTSNIITNVSWSTSPDFSNPFATTQQVTVSPSTTQFYFIVTTDSLGCKDSAQAVVNVYPLDVEVPDLLNYCNEIGELTIPVTTSEPFANVTYEWVPSQYTTSQNADGSIVVQGLTDDQLFVLTAANIPWGCTDTDSAYVYFYDIEPTLGQITSTEDTILYLSGENSQLEIDLWPGYTYVWSPSEGLSDPNIHNPVAEPLETTTYTVTVTDEGGCTATRSVTIVVLNPDCEEPNLFLPNAFTPNGDAHNSVLYFRSNIVAEMELAIYDRWGQRVFYSTDQSIGWDGTFKGNPLTPDVYGFYLHAKCYNGQEYFKKGNITLLR